MDFKKKVIFVNFNYDSMIPIYECIKGTFLGSGVGALVTMVLYTTGILEKIKNRRSKQMKIVAIFCFGIVAICIIVSLILSIKTIIFIITPKIYLVFYKGKMQ